MGLAVAPPPLMRVLGAMLLRPVTIPIIDDCIHMGCGCRHPRASSTCTHAFGALPQSMLVHERISIMCSCLSSERGNGGSGCCAISIAWLTLPGCGEANNGKYMYPCPLQTPGLDAIAMTATDSSSNINPPTAVSSCMLFGDGPQGQSSCSTDACSISPGL